MMVVVMLKNRNQRFLVLLNNYILELTSITLDDVIKQQAGFSGGWQLTKLLCFYLTTLCRTSSET